MRIVPLLAAGDLIEPPISDPIPSILPLKPINAPSPPDEPPQVSVELKGFVVTLTFVSPVRTMWKLAVARSVPIYIATGLQMHQTLRLRGPNIKDGSRLPQYLQEVGILLADPTDPRYKSGIEVAVLHS